MTVLHSVLEKRYAAEGTWSNSLAFKGKRLEILGQGLQSVRKKESGSGANLGGCTIGDEK